MERCAQAIPKKYVSINALQDSLSKIGLYNFRLIPLGANEVVLEFESKDEILMAVDMGGTSCIILVETDASSYEYGCAARMLSMLVKDYVPVDDENSGGDGKNGDVVCSNGPKKDYNSVVYVESEEDDVDFTIEVEEDHEVNPGETEDVVMSLKEDMSVNHGVGCASQATTCTLSTMGAAARFAVDEWPQNFEL